MEEKRCNDSGATTVEQPALALTTPQPGATRSPLTQSASTTILITLLENDLRIYISVGVYVKPIQKLDKIFLHNYNNIVIISKVAIKKVVLNGSVWSCWSGQADGLAQESISTYEDFRYR